MTIRTLAMAVVCSLGFSAPGFAGAIQVTNAEAAMERDGTTADVFMTITNNGSTTDRLYAIKSKVTKVTAMSAIGEKEEEALEAAGLEGTTAIVFEVKPGQPLVLSEAGRHIELRRLKQPLKEGETVMLTLLFETAGPVKVTVEVEEN